MENERRPRLIVADDHEQFRHAMSRILSTDYEVVGDASDGASLVEMLSRLRPDAVVMDIQMPTMNGLVACAIVRREFPGIPVIIVTGLMDDELDVVARDAGAASFVHKHRLVVDLPRAVHRALMTTAQSKNGGR